MTRGHWGEDDSAVTSAVYFVGFKNPTPALRCGGAAIVPRPAGSGKLVSDDFPVLHVATASQAKSIYEQ